MADSSPAFNPPMNRITDDDPMIVRIPLDKVDFAARKSQQPAIRNDFAIRHISNSGSKS